MPDITMCDDTKCAARKSCYRFTAKPSEFRQSYFADVMEKNKHGSCEYFTANTQPHTQYEVQHRMASIKKAQLEVFEKKITEARTLKPVDYDTGLAHIETEYDGVHIVVMAAVFAEAAYAMSKELSILATTNRSGGYYGSYANNKG